MDLLTDNFFFCVTKYKGTKIFKTAVSLKTTEQRNTQTEEFEHNVLLFLKTDSCFSSTESDFDFDH